MLELSNSSNPNIAHKNTSNSKPNGNKISSESQNPYQINSASNAHESSLRQNIDQGPPQINEEFTQAGVENQELKGLNQELVLHKRIIKKLMTKYKYPSLLAIACIIALASFFFFYYGQRKADWSQRNPLPNDQKSEPTTDPSPEIKIDPVQPYDLVRLNSTTAKCIDGSPYSYYISRNGDTSKILIMMVGGAWCGQATEAATIECYFHRSKTYLGSSNFSQQVKYFGDGILSNDNKSHFKTWKKIFMTYCDGSGHQGFRKQPIVFNGTSLYLRGYNNTVETFEDLQTRFGLFTKTEQVVLAGQSAGGVAVYTWANYLKGKIKKAKMVAISDSSIFYDVEDKPTGTHSFRTGFASMMNLANKQVQFPVHSCIQKFPNSKQNCFFVQNLMEFIEVPIFQVQAVYDYYELKCVMNLGECIDKGINTCENTDRNKIEDNRQNVTKILNKLTEKKLNGAWGTKCIMHGIIIYYSYMSPKYTAPANSTWEYPATGNGLMPGEAIAKWMADPHGKNVHMDFSEETGSAFCF